MHSYSDRFTEAEAEEASRYEQEEPPDMNVTLLTTRTDSLGRTTCQVSDATARYLHGVLVMDMQPALEQIGYDRECDLGVRVEMSTDGRKWEPYYATGCFCATT